MPKNRRALPVRCGMAGANDASLFPANPKGARVLPFQRQTERRLLCLPVLRTDFRTSNSFVFSIPLLSPHSLHVARQPRSTGAVGELYHFHSEGGKKGAPFAYFAGTASEPLLYCSVTLLFMSGKLFYQGLSARVSDNRSLHGYCHDLSLQRKEGACFIITIKSYSILLLCIKYIFSCILNI